MAPTTTATALRPRPLTRAPRPPRPARPARAAPRCPRPPRSGDDDEIIPLLAPHPDHFTEQELAALAHPRGRLGGATQGEELALLRERYLEAEARAAAGERRLHTASKGGNWDGDVYVGSAWNVATVLAAVSALTTAVGLAVAILGKGTIWGIDADYASFF